MGGDRLSSEELEQEKKYRITPFQQMMSSCTGALLTSVLGMKKDSSVFSLI